MAKWYKIPPTFRITEREYRANIDGINIVFGAVLGFVLARAENLPTYDFVILLLMSASVVVTILYLGSSQYRLFYGLTTAASIGFLPTLLQDVFEIAAIPQLQATLGTWALMVVMVELLPREENIQDKVEKENQE
ncbi:MAG: hypothetical protein ABJP48_11275 [Erythrobacter sp.]